MMSRCYDKKNQSYNNYGARGIIVSKSWHSFEKFAEDMHETWSPDKRSLDRINNSKGYSKRNCRWASLSEQARNRRTTRVVYFQGQLRPLIEVSELTKIKLKTLSRRILTGVKEENWFKPARSF